jgi:hypothetical protein
VDSIYYSINEDGTYKTSVRGINQSEIWKNDSATLNDIEKTLGKDIAQKFSNNEGRDLFGRGKSLEGNDLKVGGKGMIGFYGSPTEGSLGIVGNVAKSLFGQEPKTVNIDTGNEQLSVSKYNGSEDITDIGGYEYIEKALFGTWHSQHEDIINTIYLENLIDEISSMGKSEKRSLESYLTRLLEHLLKLAYWESELEYNQRGWKNEIRNFRRAIKRIIADSPSLQPYLIEIFNNSFQEARISFIELSGMAENLVSLAPICTIEQSLNEDWFPEISK